jgi:putative ABC transport system ATP-binding protein
VTLKHNHVSGYTDPPQIHAREYSIAVTGLEYAYPSSKSGIILSIGQWQVEKGERLFLYGNSGSGKSTLLNLVSGILVPQSGSIKVLGVPLEKLGGWDRDRFRAQNIGIIFQQFNLLSYLTVRENVELASSFSPSPADQIQQRMRHLFRKMELSESLISRRADTLSVGQQQRVAIVRALINRPAILIADEPTSALDYSVRDAFMHLLTECIDEYKPTLIFISHDLQLSQHFSRVIDLNLINNQRVIADVV